MSGKVYLVVIDYNKNTKECLVVGVTQEPELNVCTPINNVSYDRLGQVVKQSGFTPLNFDMKNGKVEQFCSFDRFSNPNHAVVLGEISSDSGENIGYRLITPNGVVCNKNRLEIISMSRSIGNMSFLQNGQICGNYIKCYPYHKFPTIIMHEDERKDMFFNKWKHWALNNNINEMIIAYLNANPSKIVYNADGSATGSSLPTQRAWCGLSDRLNMYESSNKEISSSELLKLASSFVGNKMANEFVSFYSLKFKNKYNASSICNGTEKNPDNMSDYAFYIILGQVTKYLNQHVKSTSEMNVSDSDIKYIGEAIKWFIKFEHINLKRAITAIVEITHFCKNGMIEKIVFDNDNYSARYPEYNNFIANHSDVIEQYMS